MARCSCSLLLSAALAALLAGGCAAPPAPPAAPPAPPPAPPPAAPGARGTPAPAATEVPTRRLSGLYRYMADAASFFDCASADQLPVLPEGEGAALQAEYLTIRGAPGVPIWAAVEGRVVMHAAEPGGAPRAALRIERVLTLAPQGVCK